MNLLNDRALVLTGFSILCLAFTAADCLAQSTLIALPTRRDMVFDHSGTYLYISTSDGWVRRYNIASGQLEPGYNLGGSLNAIDIAPDDSFLLVAQDAIAGSQGTVHRVNLTTGAVIDVKYTRASTEEGGAWDLGIASNGLAFVATRHLGAASGLAPLRQIDLATNEITLRAAPGYSGLAIGPKTQLHRSADRTRFYFLEGGTTAGPIFTYHAPTDAFGPNATAYQLLINANAAVSRTGSILASRLGNSASFDTVTDFAFLRSFADATSGVAFDAVADRFYAVASTGQVRAYDTNTYAELYRVPIGESIAAGGQFGTGTTVASNDGRYLAVASSTGIRLLSLPTKPAPPLAPGFAAPRDMVFSHSGTFLYISTADGFVWPYHLASGTFGVPYHLGGLLNAVDIAPDDSFLLVSQFAGGLTQGVFHKLDLASGAVTKITYTRASGEGNPWDVAVGPNGLALATLDVPGSGWSAVRQITLATGAMAARTDAPGSGPGGRVTGKTQLHRSADRTRMYLLEPNTTNGPRFTYSATTNSFGPAVRPQAFVDDRVSAAVSRNGGLLATRLFTTAALETAPNFSQLRSFNALNSGVAFDAMSDTLYGVSSLTSQIIAYDTNTYAERFRFDVGETMSAGATQFGPGVLVASHDGRYLALRTPTTVRVFGVPAVQLVSVASVKSHGGSAYEIDLPLDGPRGVECRSGGSNRDHTIVFTFGQNLVSVGGAAITSGTGTISSSMIDSGDPRRYIVNLTGVTNAQYIRVTLNNVLDVLGNQTGLISQQMGVLEGDTNGNGATNATDVGQVKGQSGQPVTAGNFRTDVTANGGAITASDISLVKSRSGSQLPQLP